MLARPGPAVSQQPFACVSTCTQHDVLLTLTLLLRDRLIVGLGVGLGDGLNDGLGDGLNDERPVVGPAVPAVGPAVGLCRVGVGCVVAGVVLML